MNPIEFIIYGCDFITGLKCARQSFLVFLWGKSIYRSFDVMACLSLRLPPKVFIVHRLCYWWPLFGVGPSRIYVCTLIWSRASKSLGALYHDWWALGNEEHCLGPFHTQKKVSKSRPNTRPKSCSVVIDPQVYCEVICDRALNQMLF